MKEKVPKYKDLLWPILKALKALGRSASIQEISEKVASDLKLSDEVLNISHKDVLGVSEFDYQCAWARTYLKKVGAVDNSKRGVWAISETGRKIRTEKEIREKVRLWENEEGKRHSKKAGSVDEDENVSDGQNWEEELIGLIRKLKGKPFEYFCQRVLREAGFKKVEVRGRSGDGGIDGVGVLQVNHLVSFHVAFQCKGYSEGNKVAPEHVRDFRGSIDGKADKGFLITSGHFTRGAKQEAVRDGAKAIDLIDGHDLCNLLRNLRLGVDIETKTVEVIKPDSEFFQTFLK